MNGEIESNALIIVPRFVVAPIQTPAAFLVEINDAVALEALLGKVSTPKENDLATDAQAKQKAVLKKIEDARVAVKAPFLEMCRLIDTKAAELRNELEKECGRLNSLTIPYGKMILRQQSEERERQRVELEKIEADKQREIKRLADEQTAKDNAAKKAQQEAEQAQREAETAQRELDRIAALPPTQEPAPETVALAAKVEVAKSLTTQAATLTTAARESSFLVAATVERIEEQAGNAAYLSSRPIQANTSRGQRLARDWDIEVVNAYELAKFHPSCVKIEPLIGEIKNCLREGIVIKGITATETVNTSVRAKRERPAIEA